MNNKITIRCLKCAGAATIILQEKATTKGLFKVLLKHLPEGWKYRGTGFYCGNCSKEKPS